MSYARYASDSNVYVYASIAGGFDCGCGFHAATYAEIIEHLLELLETGRLVPQRAFNRLWCEWLSCANVDASHEDALDRVLW